MSEIVSGIINNYKVKLFVVKKRHTHSELEWLISEFTNKTEISRDGKCWVIRIQNSSRDNDFVQELVDRWGYDQMGDAEYHKDGNVFVYWVRKR